MTSKSTYRVVIQHLTGAKANQIEEIPLADKTELLLGRDASSTIAFDPIRDDVVSRRHATIKIIDGELISFKLLDNNSSNGTFLNDERISGEKELLPQDTIKLGANGPKLVFDVQPRPAHLGARTRVIDVSTEAATKVVDLAATTKTAAPPPGATAWTAAAGADTRAGASAADTRATASADTRATTPPPPPPPQGIGKETLLRELKTERQKTGKLWMATLAGLGALALLVGGGLYWRQSADKQVQQAALERVREEAAEQEKRSDVVLEETEKKLKRDIGIGAQRIVQKYGNSTALLDIEWRLYDRQTGKPVFQQTSAYRGETLRDYVRLVLGRNKEVKIVPWLTLDDSARTNVPIGRSIGGTAFVVDEHGYLLTAKHLAKGWTEPFESDRSDANRFGWLWEYRSGPDAKKKVKPERIDLTKDEYREASNWSPNDGGFVFTPGVARTYGPGKAPDASMDDHRIFEGRNDKTEVRFPDTIAGVNASFVRASDETDAALLKIETPQLLKAVVLAEESAKDEPVVAVGASVFVLGFPAISEKTYTLKEQIEKGRLKQYFAEVPKPFVSEGIVSMVAPKLSSHDRVTTTGQYGELMQLSINSTGPGNSGGPVFNSEGKVVGIFTSRFTGEGGITNSGAVPIRFGQELLRFQHE